MNDGTIVIFIAIFDRKYLHYIWNSHTFVQAKFGLRMIKSINVKDTSVCVSILRETNSCKVHWQAEAITHKHTYYRFAFYFFLHSKLDHHHRNVAHIVFIVAAHVCKCNIMHRTHNKVNKRYWTRVSKSGSQARTSPVWMSFLISIWNGQHMRYKFNIRFTVSDLCLFQFLFSFKNSSPLLFA